MLVVLLACAPRSEAPAAAVEPAVEPSPPPLDGAVAMTPDAGIVDPPAPPVWYRQIIAVKPARDGSTVTLDGGKQHGVLVGRRGTVVDRDAKPVRRGDVEVVTVDDRVATARCKLSPAELAGYTRVRLEPPP
jgi:hypothetical protein